MFLASHALPQFAGTALEAVLVLSVGVAGLAAAAWAAARCARSATAVKACWQIAVLGSLLLVACELTGVARLASMLVTANAGARPSPTKSGTQGSADGDAIPDSVDKLVSDDPLAGFDMASRLALEQEPWPSDAPWFPGSTPPDAFGLPPDSLVAASDKEPSDELLGREIVAPAIGSSPVSRGPSATSLLGLWLAGSLLLILRLGLGRVLLWRFARRLHPPNSSALVTTANETAWLLGLRRLRLLEASNVESPLAFGLVRSTIVVPRGFAARFTDSEQRAMLAHEAAHLAGRDPAWQSLADVLAVALWWHPLVWWLRARLRAASETVADEASLLVADGPELLADCLVRLGGRLLRRPRPLGYVAAAGDGFRSSLGRRVARLLSLSGTWRRPARRRWQAAILAGASAAVVMTTWFTSFARSQGPPQGDDDMSVIKQSWRSSLAGVALFALLGGDASAQGDGPPAPDDERKADAPRDRDAPRAEGDRDPGSRPDERRPDNPRPDAVREGERDRPRPDGPPRDGERRPDGPRERRPDGPPREGDRPGPARVPEPRLDGPGGEAMRKAHHLMQAAENLQAAGLGDQAEGLRRQAQELMEHARREHAERGDAPRGERPRPVPPGPPGETRREIGRGEGFPGDAIIELTRQLQELRAEVAELRQAVQATRGGEPEHRERELRERADRARRAAEAEREAAERAVDEARQRERAAREAGAGEREAAERERQAAREQEAAERERRAAQEREEAARREREKEAADGDGNEPK
jgi:hypothetical protein